MSLYNPEGTPPVTATGVARIERRLPYPGEVLVRTGGRVEPEDVIARAFVPVPPQIVNVAQILAIPAMRVGRSLRYDVNDTIEAGDVLASTGLPLIGRSCQAPIGGVVSSVDNETGYVSITPDPQEVELMAAVRGIVMEVQPYRGVIIETPAAQIYGAFGLGTERSGVTRLLVTDPNEVVTPDYIDARSAYAILICGGSITAAALQRAVEEQVRGVVVGSIDEEELRMFMGGIGQNTWYTGKGTWRFPGLRDVPDPGLTIVVTEGFGTHAMAQPIFDLLSSRDRQEALIEGTTQLRHGMHRPRLVIPLARSTGDIEPQRLQIQPGVTVRLLDAAHLGQVARVQAVSLVPWRTESGVSAPAVEVVQDDNDTQSFWVPRTAVEVVA
jgi:hypothetical protein